MGALEAGAGAPDFKLADQDGKIHKLADYRGKWVALYFYPKDDTPGCTKQACGFRDNLDDLRQNDIAVLGVSILGVPSKAKFAAKHQLNFPLLADEGHEVAEAYGVWKEKSLYGRKFLGISRETFIIDPQGKIAHHFAKAKGNEAHAKEVLKVIKSLE